MFLMDSSGSVAGDFPKEKEFVKKVAEFCGISKEGSRASVVSYSRDANIDIKLLDNFNNRGALLLGSIHYIRLIHKSFYGEN